MKYAIVLAALFACTLSAEHKPRWVLPRVPLAVLLSGNVPIYDANDPKIVGGQEVTPHEIPFQVALTRGGSLFCGGSVLTTTKIITAAHCTDGILIPGNIDVVAGEHSLSKNDGTEQSRTVSKIVQHESYNANKIDNDVSVLILSSTSPLTLNAYVAVVKLPAQNEDPAAGTQVTVTGWGTTSQSGSISDVLRKVQVHIISRTTCDSNYSGAITNNMICAGETNGGKDSCQGDSGGPLFTGTGANAVQHGIVSWGRGCAQANYPGVYTRVGNYVSWINNAN